MTVYFYQKLYYFWRCLLHPELCFYFSKEPMFSFTVKSSLSYWHFPLLLKLLVLLLIYHENMESLHWCFYVYLKNMQLWVMPLVNVLHTASKVRPDRDVYIPIRVFLYVAYLVWVACIPPGIYTNQCLHCCCQALIYFHWPSVVCHRSSLKWLASVTMHTSSAAFLLHLTV